MGKIMEVMTYSAFRKDLATALDKVTEDRNPVLITRQSGEPAVLMSLKDYNAYEETAYLMSNPKNAQRLRQSLANARTGEISQRDLIEK